MTSNFRSNKRPIIWFTITGLHMSHIIRHIPTYYLLTRVLLSKVFAIRSLVLGMCFLWSLCNDTSKNCWSWLQTQNNQWVLDHLYCKILYLTAVILSLFLIFYFGFIWSGLLDCRSQYSLNVYVLNIIVIK